MIKKDTYRKAFDADKELVENYFKKIEKSEQQKFLEKLYENIKIGDNYRISDIGCGGGKLSFHLSNIYPNAEYHLLDYNEDAIKIANDINKSKKNFSYKVADIYSMPYKDNTFDITNCLVVISFIEDAQKAVEEILRVTKSGGHIFISALVNLNHNVDLLTKVLDKTRESSKEKLYLTYNTYSKTTFEEWMKNKVSELNFYQFDPSIDFTYEGKGIDTYTIDTKKRKLQLAGGMLLNWGFIHAVKK